MEFQALRCGKKCGSVAVGKPPEQDHGWHEFLGRVSGSSCSESAWADNTLRTHLPAYIELQATVQLSTVYSSLQEPGEGNVAESTAERVCGKRTHHDAFTSH